MNTTNNVQQDAQPSSENVLCQAIIAAIDNNDNFVSIYALADFFVFETYKTEEQFQKQLEKHQDKVVFANPLDTSLLELCADKIYHAECENTPQSITTRNLMLEKISVKLEEFCQDQSDFTI